MPNLTDLQLERCARLTDHAVSKIAKYGKFLKRLNLGRYIFTFTHLYLGDTSRCSSIGDSVSALGFGISSLVDLDLSFLTKLSDRVLIALAQLPRLLHLRLEGCLQLSDAALEPLKDKLTASKQGEARQLQLPELKYVLSHLNFQVILS